MSHEIIEILARVDSGANANVGNHPKYFSRLKYRKIPVELGTAVVGQFEGIGIITVSIPEVKDSLFLLYPAYLSTTDTCCTISNGALLKYSNFKSVLLDTHKSMSFTLHNNRRFTVPFHTKDNIDYIPLHIHIPSRKKAPIYRHMSMQPASLTNKKVTSTQLFTYWLHIITGHTNVSILQEMIDKGMITGPGLPCKLAPIPGRCPICDAASMSRVPRARVSDSTPLPVGVMFHMDFLFYNKVSFRGFTAALIIVERTSRYTWIFPTRSKGAPIHLCLYFFNQLIRLGLPCVRCRTDEDGALIRCTEFCKMVQQKLNMVMESTGGYNSSLNGTVESPIRPLKIKTRAMLIGAMMDDMFWCAALMYAALIRNNILHSATKKIPSIVLTGTSIAVSAMHPFGARTKVLRNLPAKRSLSARTSGDLRFHQDDYDADAVNLLDTTQPSSFTGRFMGHSNHQGIILVLTDEQNGSRLARVRHSLVDHYALSASTTDVSSPNEIILRDFHNKSFDVSDSAHWQVRVNKSNLDTVKSPFNHDDCITFSITLPPKGTSLGISFDTDEDYVLPLLARVTPTSLLYDEIPAKYHNYKYWVIQIGNQFPITANGAVESLHFHQAEEDSVTIDIILCKAKDDVRYFSELESIRVLFDGSNTKRFAYMDVPDPILAHMITSAKEPTAHKSISKCISDPEFGPDWLKALDFQYDKNDAIKLVSQPMPLEEVPYGTKIHRPVISTKVKKKGDTLFQLVARMCADGSKQEQGIDFEYSYSPTAGAAAVRALLAIAASYSWLLSAMDVTNCFQSTIIPEEELLTIHAPPNYLHWFKNKYPTVKIPASKSDKYVLRILNGIQGDKSIGRKWYLLLKKLLENFGFKCCPTEPSVFVYEKDDVYFILNTSTDDFLCAHSTQQIYDDLCEYFKKFFSMTFETKVNKFKYLNLRIISTEHGVSYDQTEHIEHKIIKKYFPDWKVAESGLKAVHTPFRTDSQYEIDLLEQLPLQGKDLKEAEKKYGGSFASILGDIMHVWVWSRLDIGYATTRLSQYTHAPNAAAFAGLYRILRYLATHPHRPIFYPRRPVTDVHELRFEYDAPSFESITLPNGLLEMVDSDHARDNATRRSCHCVLALLCGVAIHWKMQQQKCIAIHSTDSEIRGAFAATKEGQNLQNMFMFLPVPNAICRPLPIYCDSQPAIDSINANTVTSRVKHVAIPIMYMHEHVKDGTISLHKINTKLNLADSGTKPNSAPVHFEHFDQAIGVRFYPPANSQHYNLLNLDTFKVSPYTRTQTKQPASKDDLICSGSTQDNTS